jgi:hypothetical protein
VSGRLLTPTTLHAQSTGLGSSPPPLSRLAWAHSLERDLNPRPPGFEPEELPDCFTIRNTEALLTQVRHELLVEKEKANQYREALKSAWVAGELRSSEAESLLDLANDKLGLRPKIAVDFEQEIMGDTIEGSQKRSTLR